MISIPADVSHLCQCVVENFEQCRLVAYRDAANVLTIGWGTTNGAVKGFAFGPGTRISQAKADDLLHAGLSVFGAVVRRAVTVDLKQYEFDALVALAYNIGAGHFQSSTLLTRLNRGDRHGAASQFLAWTHGGGRVLPGLVTRRRCEALLFTGDIHGAIALAVSHGRVPDHPDDPSLTAVVPGAPHLVDPNPAEAS